MELGDLLKPDARVGRILGLNPNSELDLTAPPGLEDRKPPLLLELLPENPVAVG